jgi:hypothetical protein
MPVNKTASIGLYLHDQSRIETLPRLGGIAARVCQNAGVTNHVIRRRVEMAMDPKLRSSLGDEPPHIRSEGWVESVPFEGCRN